MRQGLETITTTTLLHRAPYQQELVCKSSVLARERY